MVEVSVGDGPVLASLSPSAPTSGPYDYITLRASFAVVDGAHDVRVRLRGPLRLARVGFSG
ncbi:hypothetical protein SHKM778_21370 [Streptomyces sp. KM77-8]|uniref:Carbohydrate-binding protein n=1 Tax=Streptomyces haneummycinicus TaxID=3074435 RepID=A0AAT9HEX9_9ACTN